MNENQIILVDKPAGLSSFGVVAKVRGYLKAEFGHKVKVGHTGTLDPFATGLLILLSGKMTKRSNEFLKKDKIYEARLKLGYTSTTGDPEGEIEEYPRKTKITKIEEHAKRAQYCSIEDPLRRTASNGATEPRNDRPLGRGRPPVDGREGARPKWNDIELALDDFIGTIQQKVPAFSAIKINGQRAYKLARAGKDFDTPTREVTIYSIDVLDYHYPYLTIRCHVSSGTYIRTLAEDIGKKLGTGAYLTSLRRTKIADYSVSSALPLSHFTTPT